MKEAGRNTLNYRMVAKIAGMVLLCFAGLMLLPMLVNVCTGESVKGFAVGLGVTAAAGGRAHTVL